MRQPKSYLSKREQQIMELVYRREKITANEAVEALPGTPSNSTVRTILRILEEKGHLRHTEEDGKYVYVPVHPPRAAAKSALKGVVETFFKGSVTDVVAALLKDEDSKLSDDELARLRAMIDAAREEER